MQVPVYGNNAYQYEEETYRAKKRPQKAVKHNKNTARGAVVVCVVLAAAFCLLFRYATMMDKSAQIRELEARLSAVNGEIVARQFEIENTLDLDKVEEIAIAKFGMQRPSKAQMVYVDMQNCDYAECQGQPTIEKNFFASIKDKFLKILG